MPQVTKPLTAKKAAVLIGEQVCEDIWCDGGLAGYPNTPDRKCDKCRGTGARFPEWRRRCRPCLGKGRTLTPVPATLGGGLPGCRPPEIDHEICQGRGWIVTSESKWVELVIAMPFFHNLERGYTPQYRALCLDQTSTIYRAVDWVDNDPKVALLNAAVKALGLV